MKHDITYPSSDGKTQIHAIIWEPEGTPKAVLQICHGMVDYADRYDDFAQHAAAQGYYVVANDHLGHGASVVTDDQHGYFGHPNGNECVIADIHTLQTMTQKKYPDLPYFFLGHSMGSFLTRQYIQMHADGLAGAVIMGTGSQPGIVLHIGKLLCRLIALFRGWEYRSSFVDNMAFGGYNKQFEPARTPSDWLTKDEAIIDACVNNPWSTFRFTVNGYYQMFRGIQYIQNPAHIQQIPKNLPLFFVAGADDPVGNNGKSVTQVCQQYKDAGIQDVQIKLYPGDRHEILNETDRDVVYADILTWLNGHLARR